jgi:hypothetical protein
VPVFHCNSCNRLLYRLEELVGRAWQCPACGPTVVSTEPVSVSDELAALLEKEYNLYATAPPPVFPIAEADSQGRPKPVAEMGPHRKPEPVASIGNDPVTRRCITIALAAIALWGLLVLMGTASWEELGKSMLMATLIVVGGWVAICFVVLLVCGVLDSLRRKRPSSEDVDSHPALAHPANGTPAARVRADMRLPPVGVLILVVAFALPVVLFLSGIVLAVDILLIVGLIACMLLVGLCLIGLLAAALLAIHRRQLVRKIESLPPEVSAIRGSGVDPSMSDHPGIDRHVQRRTDIGQR